MTMLAERLWLSEKIAKLERHLASQQTFSSMFEDGSIIKTRSDDVCLAMAAKLARLREIDARGMAFQR